MNESHKNIVEELQEGLLSMVIKGVSIDSRTVREGELFTAIRGDRYDGHDFVPDAIRKGAWGALVERTVLETKYETMGDLRNVIPVEDTLFSLQEMALIHRKKFLIPVVAVTGSNGKTTTTTDSAEVAYTTQYNWMMTNVETITGTTLKIGDQVNFTLKRIAASADDYAGELLVGTIGFHYQCDTLGSRQIGTK